MSEDRRAQPARCSGRLHPGGQCHALPRPPEPHPSLRSRPHAPHEDGEWVRFTSKSIQRQRQGAKVSRSWEGRVWAKIRPDICMLSQTHYLLTLTSGVISDWQCSLSHVARWSCQRNTVSPLCFYLILNKLSSLFLKGDWARASGLHAGSFAEDPGPFPHFHPVSVHHPDCKWHGLPRIQTLHSSGPGC